jgi:hypothetical protein
MQPRADELSEWMPQSHNRVAEAYEQVCEVVGGSLMMSCRFLCHWCCSA